MPGVYREGELDLAGTCVGLVRREDLIDGTRVVEQPADADLDLLLEPTRLYLDDVRALRGACDVRALAHVTGGGIAGNLARVLPAGLGARIDAASWPRPPVYAWLDERGVSEEEQRRVFNLGIGMCAIVPAADAGSAPFPAVGRIERGEGIAFA
jgi:phosphoribosylformylglycinamidine cyclo-ligase